MMGLHWPARLSGGRLRVSARRATFPDATRSRGGCVRAGVALGAIGLALLGSVSGQDASDQAALRVVVSTPPQAGIVERVGGARVAAQVLIQPGQDPHTFEPAPRQIMEIGAADAYLLIGLPFEDRLVKKLREGGSALRFADMGAGIARRSFRPGEGDDHGHGHDAIRDHGHDAIDEPGNAHAHAHAHDHGPAASVHSDDHASAENLDPHVWLGPGPIERLAQNAAGLFQELDPTGADEYASRLEAFRAEIHAADARIRELLAPFRGERFYVFHPAFGYFADAYGLEQIAAEIEGKEPGPRRLAAMIASARADSVRIIFVQPQFSTQAAAALASAIGGAVVPMDPLARDVLENLERVARAVHAALAR